MHLSSLWQSMTSGLRSRFIKNSFMGVFANLLQNIFFSLFFIIVARRYNTIEFSSYILANTLYGLVLAFSSLGLGQWFVRRLLTEVDKEVLINQFFKLQLLIGIAFYGLNIGLAFLFYKDHLLRQLTLIIGLNVIFDNIIYVIKHINIAQMEQKKTLIIQTAESLLKIAVGCILLFIPIPMVVLAVIIITLRFLTLNVFLNIGTSFKINLAYLFKAKIDLTVFKEIVFNNWPFIVIGSISVLYWKMGNILISRFLTLEDVAHYEISFKVFSIAEVIPVIISTSIFPVLLNKMKQNKELAIKFYKKVFISYALYGLLAFTFIHSFADEMIPAMFGEKYTITSRYCKEMFLTMLIFPTAILQANLLIALNQEKIDMWLNIISLIINTCLALVGLYVIQNITVVNMAIFISFFCFHLLQDYILIKRSLTSIKEAVLFYVFIAFGLVIYYILSQWLIAILVFCTFWGMLLVFIYSIILMDRRQKLITGKSLL